MYEYIKRTDAINEINRGDLLVGNCAEWAREIIWRTPYADVAEVKRGRWIHDINNLYGCSECLGRETMSPKKLKNYCPYCGAQMIERN